MQRLDSPEYIIRRLEEISAIDNLAVVIDLLFGFPGQKGKVWTDDLKIASELPIDGVDCYQLNVFEKSPLNTRIKSGLCEPAATLAEAADMYAESVEHFSANPIGPERRLKGISTTVWQKVRVTAFPSAAEPAENFSATAGCRSANLPNGQKWLRKDSSRSLS